MEETDLDFIAYYVYVPLPLVENFADIEYEMFETEIKELIREGIIPDLSVHIYFVDSDMAKECEKYYSTRTETYAEFAEKLDTYDEINVRYENGEINISYEDYIKTRQTIGIN